METQVASSNCSNTYLHVHIQINITTCGTLTGVQINMTTCGTLTGV
jgi:hypothetical protein